jgi:hypothetical protein
MGSLHHLAGDHMVETSIARRLSSDVSSFHMTVSALCYSEVCRSTSNSHTCTVKK